MKTLILFRHAKSDWSSGHSADHDRPLAPRGKQAAELMGRYLRKIGEIPDSVVTSSAVRARKTAELAVKAGKWKCKIRVEDDLYACSPADMLSEIQAEPDTTTILVVVGHEPTCSETIARLAGELRVHFSTAAMIRLDLPVERWSEANFGHAQLIWLVTPTLLKGIVGE